MKLIGLYITKPIRSFILDKDTGSCKYYFYLRFRRPGTLEFFGTTETEYWWVTGSVEFWGVHQRRNSRMERSRRGSASPQRQKLARKSEAGDDRGGRKKIPLQSAWWQIITAKKCVMFCQYQCTIIKNKVYGHLFYISKIIHDYFLIQKIVLPRSPKYARFWQENVSCW